MSNSTSGSSKETNTNAADSGSGTLSAFQSSLIWFGAGVSIAEILTGTYLAPLGFAKGIAAVLLGHLIGCAMMYFAGMIGGRTRLSSMETTKMSFGRFGGVFFAFLNVLQLVGWTAIMIYDGAGAVNEVFGIGAWVWALVIGALILVWIAVGITNLGVINKISMAALFILTIVLCVVIFGGGAAGAAADAGEVMSFGAAVELSVAMPLSWLPLISDYTREAAEPKKATLTSVVVYGLVSCWMYLIGMGAAILTGEYDISKVIVRAGLGIAGLVILILSTVTTTFLDAWSAGISAESLTDKLKGKGRTIALIVTVLGTVLAVCFNMDDITNFLYLIGSVFAPMIAVQVADFFFLHEDHREAKLDLTDMICWAAGFALYRVLMKIDLPLGNTLPDFLITMVLVIVVRKVMQALRRASTQRN